MIPLALICLALLALVVWERRDHTTREKEWALERGGWAMERRELLNRIKPEVAVASPDGGEEPVLITDDEEEFAAIEELESEWLK